MKVNSKRKRVRKIDSGTEKEGKEEEQVGVVEDDDDDVGRVPLKK